MKKQHATVLTLSLMLTVPAAQGTVWRVNPDGTADFTDPVTAAAAAADGDTLLIEGEYFLLAPVDVDAKSVTLIGQEGASIVAFAFGVNEPPAIHVHNLGPDQSATVRGLELLAAYADPGNLLYIESNAGAVHIEEVTTGSFGAGITIVDSASVTVVDSLLSGNGSFVSGGIVTDSNAFFYDTSIDGADGPPEDCTNPFAPCIPPGWGGEGLRLNGQSQVVLSNCTVNGGDAGCASATSAGVGIHIGAGSIVHNRGSIIAGGSGDPGGGCTTPGSDAIDVAGAGLLTEPSGEARSFGWAPSVVQGGSKAEFTYTGTEGDFVFLLYRFGEGANAGVWLDPLFALHLDLPNLGILPRGSLPAGGVLVDTIGVPPVAAALSFQAQALFSTVGGPWVTSGPSMGLFNAP